MRDVVAGPYLSPCRPRLAVAVERRCACRRAESDSATTRARPEMAQQATPRGPAERRECAVAMRGRDRHAGSEIGVQGPAGCGGAGAGLAALACGSWPDGGSHADDLQLRWIFARGAVGPASSGVR